MINNSLKVERARKNVTQAALAQVIGVSRQTINSIEKNRYIPSTILALRLSQFFGVSVNDLFQLQEDKQVA